MTVHVLVADDHPIVRSGVRMVLEGQKDLAVVGEAAGGREAVDLARKLKPAVVLIDISMPDLSGIEATRRILADAPQVKVIALSMHADKRYVAEMLKAGARGYLLKDGVGEEVVRAIREVMAGGVYLAQRVAGTVVQDYVQRLAGGDDPGGLTPREREVLALVADGRSSKEIAAALHVSPKTIETHRLQIMGKLELHSVAQLTKYAIRQGLTSLEP